MFARHLQPVLADRARHQPVVTVTGPRQSGKTTLCRQTFDGHRYVNLERPDTRAFAISDPQGFLAGLGDYAIIDEIQRVPDLLSWIQVDVDARPAPGRFILTGSHQFELARQVAQSLAGRTALLRLLPLSLAELADAVSAGTLRTTDELIVQGGYPRIHANGLNPAVALADYFETYVQRDLRELIQLRNLPEFERFVRLAAGRVGQVLNLNSLAGDVGVSGHTAREWVNLLEASFIVFRLPPWFSNIGKRLIKSPKLYFYDVGLAAWLMGIREPAHLSAHPLRGNLFENLAVLEAIKTYYNAGERPDLHFYRDSAGNEVDLLIERPERLLLVEIKAAQTVSADAMRRAAQIQRSLFPKAGWAALVYDGADAQRRTAFDVVPLRQLHRWLRGA